MEDLIGFNVLYAINEHHIDKLGECRSKHICIITIVVNLGLCGHFEIVANIRTWTKSHGYWRML